MVNILINHNQLLTRPRSSYSSQRSQMSVPKLQAIAPDDDMVSNAGSRRSTQSKASRASRGSRGSRGSNASRRAEAETIDVWYTDDIVQICTYNIVQYINDDDYVSWWLCIMVAYCTSSFHGIHGPEMSKVMQIVFLTGFWMISFDATLMDLSFLSQLYIQVLLHQTSYLQSPPAHVYMFGDGLIPGTASTAPSWAQRNSCGNHFDVQHHNQHFQSCLFRSVHKNVRIKVDTRFWSIGTTKYWTHPHDSFVSTIKGFDLPRLRMLI